MSRDDEVDIEERLSTLIATGDMNGNGEVRTVAHLADRVLSVGQLRNLTPPTPLVVGLVDLDSVVIAYGAPGEYKSVSALDLAQRVATGTRWHGNRAVTQGGVLYIAAEGASGMPARIDAWKAATMTTRDPAHLSVLPEAVNLLSPSAVADLTTHVRATAPVLVVVDTLARCLVGGDENSAKDMGIAVAALDQIRRAAGSCVYVVHHSGKDRAAGARGSSALLGAADTMLSITADGTTVTITPTKQKHHPTGTAQRLTATPFAGSVALVAYDGVLSDDLSPRELDALTVLRSIETPNGIAFTTWRDAGIEQGISKATVSRALKKAQETGLIGSGTSATEKAPRYVLTDAGRSQLDTLADTGGEQA